MVRTAIVFVIILVGLVAGARAADSSPLKSTVPGPSSESDPEVLRQGGDTMDDAFVIAALPFVATGTCVGYQGNYDWNCPYIAGPYGDVVYAYTPVADQVLDIDMCGTFEDSILFVFYLDDGVPVLHACNDDYWFDDVCGEYVARIPDMPAAAGVTCYIVVKGFWQTLESYQISVTQYEPVATETRDWSDVKGLFR